MIQLIRNASTLALVASAPFSNAEEMVQILNTGLWHGNEVTVDAGADWWGIFPEGDGFTLQAAPVTITVEHDAIVDAEGEATGKRVSVPQEAEPVLLVRGIAGLKEGRLAPLYHQPHYAYLFPSQTLWLRIKDGEHKLARTVAALGTTEENGITPEPFVHNYTLKLYAGSHPVTSSQVLYTAERVYEEARPSIVWAGDIDRDGQVDLLLNTTYHYNVTRLVLYLSSAAKEGELVGKVAEWRTTGC
ncbi:MAG: hypothetical protein KF886_04915 [Candidatus Hydrogenedentes bacterium]|nr:hypothetical protein [Candidatus Hydrogenedentota bacterium]